MAKKGENIYLRKDGRWEGRYIKGRRPDGKPLFGYIYGKQYSEVKRRLILIKSELYQNPVSCVICGDGSFRDWGEYWLEVLTRPHVKPTTYAGYRRNAEKHIYPVLGTLKLSAVTAEDIQRAVDLMQQTLAATTLQGVCRLLKSILKAALDKNLISQNPYQGIRLPKARRRPPRVLTRTEQFRLEQKLSETGEAEYLLCLYTGIRIGELCALRWEDVDFENRLLHINHAVQRIPNEDGRRKTHLILGTPKTEDSIREIPMPQFLSSILQEKWKLTQSAFLFSGPRGSYKDPRTMQLRIVQLCQGLGIQGVHMHTLRHTFATRCLEKGIRYDVLCEFLGHSSPQITLRHYAHCTPEDKRQSIDLLERFS